MPQFQQTSLEPGLQHLPVPVVWILPPWLISNHHRDDPEHRLRKRRVKPALTSQLQVFPAHPCLGGNLTFQSADTFSCSLARKHSQLSTRRKRQSLPKKEDNLLRVICREHLSHLGQMGQAPRGPSELHLEASSGIGWEGRVLPQGVGDGVKAGG